MALLTRALVGGLSRRVRHPDIGYPTRLESPDPPTLQCAKHLSPAPGWHSASNSGNNQAILTMACLILIYDNDSAFLVDLAVQATGYRLCSRECVTDKAAWECAIIGVARIDISQLDALSSSIPTSNPVTTVNLRCIDHGYQYGNDSIHELFDHEYMFLPKSFHQKDFCRFLSFITGQSDYFSQIKGKKRSVYIGLTYPNVHIALPNITIVSVGADALELRVDLLRESDDESLLPGLEYVAEQFASLRSQCELPIIFTIRLEQSRGR
jgi:3-dehydroquinate dehydratase I